MNKHTQGPWTLNPQATNHQTLTGATAGLIADIHKDEDALLIAAAPELLACLLDVLEADGDLYAMDFDRYREVISKATGEPEEVDTYHEWDCRGDA
jgi:hypothetical protein